MHSQRSPKWLIRPRNECLELPTIFCFHHAGGSASVFRDWRSHLEPYFNVVAVEIPGRGSRFGEQCASNFSDLVGEVSKAVRNAISGPYYLFGHSMGALIAYEVASRLEVIGRKPRGLIVSAQKAAHLRGQEKFLGQTSTAKLSQAEFISMLQRYGGMPERILNNPDMLELYLPVLRADFELVESYRFEERSPIECPIWPIGGSKDCVVSSEELEAWSSLTRQPIESLIFSGGHFYLFQEPEKVCAAIVRRTLEGFHSPSSYAQSLASL